MVTDLERQIEKDFFINENAKKPRKQEIRNEQNKLIQIIEISDDNLIIVTKTNPNGL